MRDNLFFSIVNEALIQNWHTQVLDLTLNGSATIESEGYPDYNYGNDTFQYWLFAAAKWGPRTRIDVRELEV